MNNDHIEMDIEAIMQQIPHRYPFLLIDRVYECVPDSHVVGVKNVTVNEPFFDGHFPGRKVMPGVLMLEALAQATGILAFKTLGDKRLPGTLYYLVGIDKAKFKRPVVPGDQLELRAKFKRRIGPIWRYETEALVDGKVVVSAEITCAPGEPEAQPQK